jgi:hypothetical protein
MMIRGRMHVTSVVFSKIFRLFSITSYKRGRRPWPSYVSLHFSCTLLPAWLTLRGVSLSLRSKHSASDTGLDDKARAWQRRLYMVSEMAAPVLYSYPTACVPGFWKRMHGRYGRGDGLFFCACVRVPSGQRMARLPMGCYMMVFSSAGREY